MNGVPADKFLTKAMLQKESSRPKHKSLSYTFTNDINST